MAIYTTNSFYDYDVDIVECKTDNMIEATSKIVAENELNYFNMMKSIGINELNYFEATGEEMIYEAGTASGFFGKIKEFFKKLWEKIKGLFHKFMAMLDGFVKSDKDFVNKYKKELYKVDTRDFKYKGFKFTLDNMPHGEKEYPTKMLEEMKKLDAFDELKTEVGTELQGRSQAFNDATLKEKLKKVEDMSDITENLRAIALGEGAKGSYTASEFTKELFEKLRDNESSPTEQDEVNIGTLLQEISGTSSTRKNVNKILKDAEKTIKGDLKDLDQLEKEYMRLVPDKKDNSNNLTQAQISTLTQGISKQYNMVKEMQSIITVAHGQYLQALKQRNRQAKSVCVKLINYKPKNEGFYYEDNYGYNTYNEGSFLDDVKMI